jgi:hypothetical protein
MFSAQVEYSASASGGSAIVIMIVELLIGVLFVAGLWKTFSKAGEPGWAAIIPIYNIITMVKIAGKPMWWVVLFFIPIVSIVAVFIIAIGIAQRFGKSAGFGVGLALLPFIFYPMLGFGSATAGPALAQG